MSLAICFRSFIVFSFLFLFSNLLAIRIKCVNTTIGSETTTNFEGEGQDTAKVSSPGKVHLGSVTAKEKIFVQAEKSVEGEGVLKAPKVVITARKFNFRGTIDCRESCVINVAKKFDPAIFKKKGLGKFIINVLSEEKIAKLLSMSPKEAAVFLKKYKKHVE